MPDLFQPGNLLRIKDFEFEDGSTRDKYLFVLSRTVADACLIFTLTTSKNRLNLSATKRGCHFHQSRSTWFFFPANEPLDANGFFFDIPSFIFFNQNIRKEAVSRLSGYASSQNALNLIHLATLSPVILKELLNCILLSVFVPNNLKAELSAFRDSL